jgi:hypothetical protein
MVDLEHNCGPIASLMIEKYLEKITRIDLETRVQILAYEINMQN